MNTLFLTWQDPDSRQWFPVGRLDVVGANGDRSYTFAYTNGALDAAGQGDFHPLVSFPDLHGEYESDTIFPLFANRVMPRSRPDYPEFVEWLSVAESADDPIAVLARSGGRRATDTLEVFPAPEVSADGQQEAVFFVHGLRHQTQAARERALSLEPGERLRIQYDVQNERDRYALTLRTDERFDGDMHTLGYFPRYIASDVVPRILDAPESVVVTVERVNRPPAPANFRLLCRLRGRWPEGEGLFAGHPYQRAVSGGRTH